MESNPKKYPYIKPQTIWSEAAYRQMCQKTYELILKITRLQMAEEERSRDYLEHENL